MKHMSSKQLDAIVDPAIGTAESILALAKRNPEAVGPGIRGTTAKYVDDAIAKVAGYKGAPIRRMQNLIKKLCPEHITYPITPLEWGLEEEIHAIVDGAVPDDDVVGRAGAGDQ